MKRARRARLDGAVVGITGNFDRFVMVRLDRRLYNDLTAQARNDDRPLSTEIRHLLRAHLSEAP